MVLFKNYETKLRKKFFSQNFLCLQKNKMFRILHYRDRCIGCYYCVEVAPQRYVMNETDGKCDLIEAQKKGEHYEVVVFDDREFPSIKKAEALCPSNVIKVEKI